MKLVRVETQSLSRGSRLGEALALEGYVGRSATTDVDGDHGVFSRAQLLAWDFGNDLMHELWKGFRAVDPEQILGFLELNPFFFRSGYLKKELNARLTRYELTPAQRQRVGKILRDVVFGGWQVSMPGWRRLSRVVEESVALRIAQEALDSRRDDVVKKATTLVLYMRGRSGEIRDLTSDATSGAVKWSEAIAWAKETVRFMVEASTDDQPA